MGNKTFVKLFSIIVSFMLIMLACVVIDRSTREHKEYTIEVTYLNSDIDTLKLKSYAKPYINNGTTPRLVISNKFSDKDIVYGVRKIKFL